MYTVIYERRQYVVYAHMHSAKATYILEDLHSLGGKNMLNMCDVFEDDYTILQLPELAMYMWL